MKTWLRTWLLLVALGYPAGLLILLVHEAIGHGVTAELVGGRFLALYLSPAVGRADFFAASGAATLTVLGAAAPLTALVGLALWTRTRGSGHLLPRVAGWYCGLGGASNLAYWGVFPWLLSRGGASPGDWAEVWHAWGVPPALPAIVSLAPLAILSALLLIDARRLVDALHPAAAPCGVPVSFALAASAGVVPRILYILAYWPHWRTLDRSLIGGLLILPIGVFFGGLIGLPIVRWRGWDREPRPTDPAGPGPAGLRPPRPAAALGWAALLLATTIGVAFLFGPATQLRTGLAIRGLTRDDYAEVPSAVRLEWSFATDGRGHLTIFTSPPPSSDSPFVATRAAAADHLGPSRVACDRLAASFAGAMTDVEVGKAIADADRSEGRWRCVAEAQAKSRRVRIAIPEGPESVTLRVPGLATRLRSREGITLALSEGAARWERPPGFEGADEFQAGY